MESEKKRGRFGKDSFPLGISQNAHKLIFLDTAKQQRESPVNTGLFSLNFQQVFGQYFEC